MSQRSAYYCFVFGYDNEFEKEDEFKHNTSVHSVELAPFLGLRAKLTFSFSFAEFFFWQQMWKTSFRATNLTLESYYEIKAKSVTGTFLCVEVSEQL